MGVNAVNKCERGTFEPYFFIKDKGEINACTNAEWNKIKIYSKEQNFYWEGNTIISKNYRSKGVGRMIYKQMGTFLERCTIGFTEAAYKIQPRAIPHSKSVSPVFVYLSVNRFFLNSLYRKWKHYRRQETDIFILWKS